MGHISKTHPDDVRLLVKLRGSEMLTDILNDIERVSIATDGEADELLAAIAIKVTRLFEYIDKIRVQ